MTRLEVVVRDVDTAKLLAVIEQIDDVIREIALVQIGMATGTSGSTLPPEVLKAMNGVREVVFRPKEIISKQVAAAWAEGRERLDVTVDIEAAAGPVVRTVLDAFDRVDDAAMGDRAMLIPSAPPEVRQFRRWFFTEVADQLEGLTKTGS